MALEGGIEGGSMVLIGPTLPPPLKSPGLPSTLLRSFLAHIRAHTSLRGSRSSTPVWRCCAPHQRAIAWGASILGYSPEALSIVRGTVCLDPLEEVVRGAVFLDEVRGPRMEEAIWSLLPFSSPPSNTTDSLLSCDPSAWRAPRIMPLLNLRRMRGKGRGGGALRFLKSRGFR